MTIITERRHSAPQLYIRMSNPHEVKAAYRQLVDDIAGKTGSFALRNYFKSKFYQVYSLLLNTLSINYYVYLFGLLCIGWMMIMMLTLSNPLSTQSMEWLIVECSALLTGTLQWLAKHPRWPMGGVTVSPVSNTNHQTKGLHALIITDQLSCPLELQKKSVSTLRVSLPLTIVVHEKVSLTCSLRWVWAHYMQQIPFTSNSFQIVSLEFNFWPSNQNHSRMIRLWFSLAE